MSEKCENRVCITRNIGGTIIKVWFSNDEDIRDSVILLERLSRRLPIEQTRIIAEELWITIAGNPSINERVTDKGHRIALSVLHAFPDAKSNSEIMNESGVSEDDAYNYLSGRTGIMKYWFTSVKKGFWILSRLGENKINDFVESLVQKYSEQ